MLAAAYPGTPVSWWLEQAEHDDQMIATALDLLEGDEDG